MVLGTLALARLFTSHFAESAQAFIHQLSIAREQVMPQLASESLGGLAATHAVAGENEQCAVLLGAARQFGGVADPAVWAELEQRFYAPARRALGEHAWQAAADAGARLSFLEAVDAAIEIRTDGGAAP